MKSIASYINESSKEREFWSTVFNNLDIQTKGKFNEIKLKKSIKILENSFKNLPSILSNKIVLVYKDYRNGHRDIESLIDEILYLMSTYRKSK